MSAKGKLTGRHVLLMVVAFFGVMIFANVIFIRAAVRTFPGVSEDKSYLQGLHYNDTIAQRAEQSQLGWRVEIVQVERDAEAGKIALRLSKDKTPLSELSVVGVLKRPTTAAADQPLRFVAQGGGVYEAEVGAFAPGVWDLALRIEGQSGEALDVEARITAP